MLVILGKSGHTRNWIGAETFLSIRGRHGDLQIRLLHLVPAHPLVRGLNCQVYTPWNIACMITRILRGG